jgi:signal transduction histidine kinase/CheY-like chemotaxis protein
MRRWKTATPNVIMPLKICYRPPQPSGVQTSDEAPADLSASLADHLDGLADVAWVVSESTHCAIAVSHTYESLFGGDRGALQADGTAWLDVVLPDARPAARAMVSAATGEPVTLPVGCPAGVRWWRLRAVRLDGPPAVVLIHGTEVSDLIWTRQQIEIERSRAERALAVHDQALTDAAARLGQEAATREEAERLLLHAERLEMLGRLTPGIAHDFNNVLAILSGTLHLIRLSAVDDRQRTLIARGERAITSATALVKRLNAFAGDKAAGGRPLDVNRTILDMGQLLRQATGARITVELQLSAERWVLADVHQLQMALLNLAINARDAMTDGGRLTITTSDVCDGGESTHVDVSVQDSGTGMTKEQLARATEPFFTTKSTARGTGLGLPMVDTFAQSSGGQFTLRSDVGLGTTATLRLLSVPPVAHDHDVPRTLRIDRARHGQATVLVVEDDPLLRPITAAYIRDLGYLVVEAEVAVEALALADRTNDLALLVTDIELPGMDGLALADRLRERRPALAFLFVTAHAEWARSGGRHVLQKPFDQAVLAARILSALRRDPGNDGETEISRHIVHPALRQFYRHWQDRRTQLRLPDCAALRAAVETHWSIAVVVRVVSDDPLQCEFEHIGSSLLDAYSASPGAAAQVIDSVESAYVECAQSAHPSYESIRYRLGNDRPVRFERVIVPCSDTASTTVSHLIGLVAFANLDPEHLP